MESDETSVMQSEMLEADAVPELVRRTLYSRPERVARSEVRRAARRAHAESDVGVRVARPAGSDGGNRDAVDLADARVYTWVRTGEAEEALARGDAAAAADILSDVLRVEQAIQVLIDDMKVAAQWRDLEDRLAEASDLAIQGIRRCLSSSNPSSGLAEVRTGQSEWIRAWRPFLLVAGQGT